MPCCEVPDGDAPAGNAACPHQMAPADVPSTFHASIDNSSPDVPVYFAGLKLSAANMSRIIPASHHSTATGPPLFIKNLTLLI